MKAGFRVRVEVDEPFELVSHTYDRVFVLGRVRAEDSSPDGLVVQADKGSTLWGRVVRMIVATPRHVGHSFDDMPGAEVIVSARAEPMVRSSPPRCGRASPRDTVTNRSSNEFIN